jgi:hypothetical protein
VGDSVQMDNLDGEVREIRGRASTIRTWDGAEVIVPNGRLTSENVTNWTLSDRLHRVDVRVAVTDASDPEQVLRVLRGVATAHPNILPEPALLVLCTGFADGAMTFELRAWTALFGDSLQVRSGWSWGPCRPHRRPHRDRGAPARYIRLRDANGDPRVCRWPPAPAGRRLVRKPRVFSRTSMVLMIEGDEGTAGGSFKKPVICPMIRARSANWAR